VTRRLAIVVAAAVVTLTLAAGAWAAFAPLATGSRELTFVIPPGTAARLKGGTPPTVLPSPIHLTVGVRDVLVITNDDEVVHEVGPIILGPRQTYRIPLSPPRAIPVRMLAPRGGYAHARHRPRARGRARAPALAPGSIQRTVMTLGSLIGAPNPRAARDVYRSLLKKGCSA
jgi:hypothetical protein